MSSLAELVHILEDETLDRETCITKALKIALDLKNSDLSKVYKGLNWSQNFIEEIVSDRNKLAELCSYTGTGIRYYLDLGRLDVVKQMVETLETLAEDLAFNVSMLTSELDDLETEIDKLP